MQLQENPIPANYLDSIAPQQAAPKVMNNRLLLMIGGLVLVIVVVFMGIMAIGPGKPKQLEVLALRLQTLQTVSQGAKKNIKSSDLRSINGNLTTYLVNTNRDIAKPLEANKVILSKIDKKTIASENGAKLLATLEDARLNAVYDRVFAQEMAYELERLNVLMTSIYKTTSSKSLKDYLDSTFDNLSVIRKQIADFNAINE